MSRTATDAIVVLGFSDDTRALIDHLGAEAPSLLPRLVVVDPSPDSVEWVHRAGVRAVCAPVREPAALGDLGLGGAAMVVTLGARGDGPDALRDGKPAGASVLANWRFWVLLGVTVVDGLVFALPVTLTLLVLGALVAPGWVRRSARFLDGLAEGR